MAATEHAHLEAGARAVLERNRRGTWTCPSIALYPHQWLWDSSFIAIGLARYDADRAAGELRALFRGQWSNGMLPHVVFADGSRDVGSRRIWRSKKKALAPRDVETSCITQPPIPAIAAWRVAQALPVPERRSFLAEVYPRLVAYHSWLYHERDPNATGLITLIHPWECGLDTTPPWMQALARMPLPWWMRVAVRLHLARALRALRYDTRHLPAAQRSSDDDGLRMLLLAVRAENHQFRLARMPPRKSVLIEDLAFNAFLVVANRSLELIARDLDQELPLALPESFRRTEAALELLWDEEAGEYYSRDAVTGGLIKSSTVATFLPLWSGSLPPERAERLMARLRAPGGFWPHHPVPSVPVDGPDFQEARYWKGPAWVNLNWAIIQGLREQGQAGLAEQLRIRTLDLVARAGFSEYFSALSGAGYGAPDFSWTAALVIDLLAPPG